MSSYDNSPSGGSGSDNLAARRARLRGTLARATSPPDEFATSSPAVETMTAEQTPSSAPRLNPVPAEKTQNNDRSGSGSSSSGQSTGSIPKITSPAPTHSASAPTTAPTHSPLPLPGLPATTHEPMELLYNIDHALNACATNLGALQRLAMEQTDVLKNLTTTLQNQTLFEIGLNLNSLTESLSAALEPMKAIGELVPAMDQLVSTIEGKEATEAVEKLSPDQLVTSLADQLSAGLIDPWTFKCAYMAVYPSDHPADLLHRLVELLGTQRLSGDLFRAAYEAVQTADAPARLPREFIRQSSDSDTASGGGAPSREIDEQIRAQLEDLRRNNDELQRRQEEREKELSKMLASKEQELQEAQELLNTRYDEFNSRYEEVADALNKREEEYRALLESKDMELVEKESEINLLRAQMEELRSQTEDMVKDMQKQLTEMKSAKQDSGSQAAQKPASTSGGFFDQPNPQQNNNSLFQTGAAKSLFEPAPQPSPTTSQQMQAVQPQPSQSTSQQMPVVQAPNAVQPPSPMAPPPQQPPQPAPRPMPQAQPTTPFGGGSGSYGSGVRAQVFEVIVRQALAGAPWREICAGPMQVNNISPEEVEAEVKRRQALLNK